MRMPRNLLPFTLLLALAAAVPAATAQTPDLLTAGPVPNRVIEHIDDAHLARLSGNTHPMARPEFDRGLLESSQPLNRLMLVLKRSPEQETALAAFNQRQYDPKSPDYHRWLEPEEFGRLFGPSDADVTAITSWLQNQGFQVNNVSKGRVTVEFTGTVAQVQNAFHLEMHSYLVDGKMHISNDRDPQIPAALAPVVTGIASLNDFRPRHFDHPGNYVKRDLKTGKYSLVEPDAAPTPILGAQAGALKTNPNSSPIAQPEFGYIDNNNYIREELSPYDVATIYNILPLWNASTPINGKGVKVAIIGLSDVQTSDFNTFRSTFGLPASTLVTMHSGSDPGYTDSQGENTEDTEMVSTTAPGATVVMVADVSNQTTDGLATAIDYVVNNNIAPILTMSYGACELNLGSSGNSFYNQLFQQAATQGVSSFVAAGDSGSTVCTGQNGQPPYADSVGLAVSGMASTPYVTAVGGTDVQWYLESSKYPYTKYWNTANDAHGASAKGYMPEMSWNDTCSNPLLLDVYTSYANVEALCNDAINASPGLVEMGAGSGGVSKCTTPSGTTSSTCSGGYAKPSWQTGVTGIPADGKRDLPDVSMFAAYGFQQSTGIPGSALLICQASTSPEKSCDYSNPNYIIYQENGGTSAASPLTAGIMALILQKAGGAKQGLANPVFYSLAAKQSYANCNSNTIGAGNSCIFNDITSGSNASVCISGAPNCVTKTSGDQAGIESGYNATTGYDLTTGLGTFNVTNLVNAWPVNAPKPAVTLTPTSLTFATTSVGATTAAQTVTVKNSGTAALTITSETFTGTNATSFVKSATTCGSSLAAGASCTVSVEFKPAAAGALTASLAIADNASGSPQTVTLKGTGAAPAVTLSPTSLTFAATKVGATTAAQTVTVKNSGTAALTITSETITGTNATSFLKSATTCGSSLAAGATCTVSVQFKPAAAGALTAALSITDNAAGSPQKVTLSGTGASAGATVTLTPSSLTFPSTVVGSTSAAQTVTFKNAGTTSVTPTALTFGGANASSFTRGANVCPATLAPGASCNFTLYFKPTTTGTLTATFSVTDNAAGSPQSVTLTGTGTSAGATVTLTPTSLTFPATTVGSNSAAQTVTFKNTGTTSVTPTALTFGGTNASSFTRGGNVCPATLSPGASCVFTLYFKPTTTGALTGTFAVTDNATGSPQKVTLTGTGK